MCSRIWYEGDERSYKMTMRPSSEPHPADDADHLPGPNREVDPAQRGRGTIIIIPTRPRECRGGQLDHRAVCGGRAAGPAVAWGDNSGSARGPMVGNFQWITC
jgi:hypothetical protein